MRFLVAFAILVCSISLFSSCKDGGSTKLSFCDTTCFKDTLKFIKEDHPLKPYVYISGSNCVADSITWSYVDLGNNRKIAIEDILSGTKVKLNKTAVSCFIKDTSYAWLSFNDCSNGRGYLLKIPYNKRDKLGVKASALNGFDPKFKLPDNLIAYSDRGNLFIEDKETGKSAMMTFGERVEINYDAIHEYVDSVNISPERIWARVKLASGWKELEKKVALK